jgi:uncharacterized membrane protein YbhN (UPF0104 family)
MTSPSKPTSDDPEPSIEMKPSPVVARLKQAAPWLVTALIFYFIFETVDFEDTWRAAQSARLEVFIPVMLIAVVLWFLIDSAAFAFLFSRFNAKVSWAEARSLRGMTYLLTPINWNLGTAAVILHLRTSKKIGAVESTSTMLFYQAIDGMVLAGFAGFGAMLLPASTVATSIRNLGLGVVVVTVISLAFMMSNWGNYSWAMRIRGLGIFQSHRKALIKDVAILIVLKSVYFSVFIGVFWLGCSAFGVELPLSFAAASTPAVMMSAALPFTPAGLGTQQAAMLYFYSPYGDEASVLAFGFTFPVVLLLLRALIGLPYLKDLPALRASMADSKEPAKQAASSSARPSL